MDLTSGRWPRWVARYEKGGWAVHFRSDIRKVGGGGGTIRFRSITKSGGGGGGNSLHVHYEKWGGGGAIRFRSITKSGGGGESGAKPQKLRKPGPAPHKRTLTLLGGGGGGGGGGFVRTPPGYGLDD